MEQLKQKTLEKISGIDDYDILQALSEDIQVYEQQQKTEVAYNFPGAREEERKQLLREADSNVEVIPFELKEGPILQPALREK